MDETKDGSCVVQWDEKAEVSIWVEFRDLISAESEILTVISDCRINEQSKSLIVK